MGVLGKTVPSCQEMASCSRGICLKGRWPQLLAGERLWVKTAESKTRRRVSLLTRLGDGQVIEVRLRDGPGPDRGRSCPRRGARRGATGSAARELVRKEAGDPVPEPRRGFEVGFHRVHRPGR